MRYKLCPIIRNNTEVKAIIRYNNDDSISSIPVNLENIDYINFKKEVNDGTELQDADGNTMTAEEAKQFIATLP